MDPVATSTAFAPYSAPSAVDGEDEEPEGDGDRVGHECCYVLQDIALRGDLQPLIRLGAAPPPLCLGLQEPQACELQHQLLSACSLEADRQLRSLPRTVDPFDNAPSKRRMEDSRPDP